ncbi:MAG: Coenzyme F420 hydrogenase/dehydrogenase, beta subunit C-terminal domain [Bacteroidaceae bacterium]|nr:Coenzyme F420 hydrogenase/dehydrogenase, beta subunit C-terminal domain [Bacteroidaceae bacterium]
MKNVSDIKDCFGCGVCAIVCPKKIIDIKLNKEGFYAPVVDGQNCIECGQCVAVCSYSSGTIAHQSSIKGLYSAYSLSAENRKSSTSGGIVYEIALSMIKKGYEFCGVRYNIEKHRAEHYTTHSESEIKASQKSKYLQSYTIDGFSQLDFHGKNVVVGTPCQIDSIRRLIKKRKSEDNFVLIDFFCHGVPSYNLWRSYLKHTQLYDIKNVQFRSKEDGWQESTYIIIISKLRIWKSKMINGDLFYKFFLGNRCLNKPCYDDCKFKTINSSADIRVGDMWGKKYCTNQEGISAVITFTEKGENIVRSLSNCSIRDESINDVLGIQMRKNAQRPLSYKFVINSLKKNKPLTFINFIASLIELPNKSRKKFIYITKRLKQLFC